MIRHACIAALLVAGMGCEAQSSLDARLGDPAPREARVGLSLALDVSGLKDPEIADRILVEEITVSMADLRLLGANPQIPAGGLKLTEAEHVLSTDDGLVSFPFPSPWLSDDLAVYVRLDESPRLGGASVVVKARFYEGKAPAQPAVSLRRLTSAEAPDPDGEPAREWAPDPDGEPARDQAPDPDGEPANEIEAPDPDGEPAQPCESGSCTQEALARSEAAGWVPIELRGRDIVDLVVDFSRGSELTVVLGVPADRWLNADIVDALERRFDPVSIEASTEQSATVAKGAVLETLECPNPTAHEKGAYRLVEEGAVDPDELRQR